MLLMLLISTSNSQAAIWGEPSLSNNSILQEVSLPKKPSENEESKVDIYLEKGMIKMNANGNLPISEEVKKAIKSGVMLYFTTQIKIEFESSVLGFYRFETLDEIEYDTRVYSFGLGEQYILLNERNHKIRSFQSLEQALRTLRTHNQLSLTPVANLPPSRQYRIGFRMRIDTLKLPAAMLMTTLMNDQWIADTGWIYQSFSSPNKASSLTFEVSEHDSNK
jgi:hypothetical protein